MSVKQWLKVASSLNEVKVAQDTIAPHHIYKFLVSASSQVFLEEMAV